ncbi:MAG: ABC transporter ATP-binding protein [Pseudomonadota bacterium]
MSQAPLVQFERLRVTFGPASQEVVAVEDLSFDIAQGETVCLVGESGSGKSVSALALMRLVAHDGGHVAAGRLLWQRRGQDPADLTSEADLSWRGRDIAMIFQEPSTALNPVLSIGRQLIEGLRRHDGLSLSDARSRALELLGRVHLSEPERRLGQFPHELSGGMRQRVMIAMALACRPRLLIADEPTTALDVTTQAEILGLIRELRAETEMAVLFITHDMAVLAQMADRVVVLQSGRKVEEGPVRQIFERPRAAYTKSLLAAVPQLGGSSGPPVTGASEPLLEVENLVTRYRVRSGLWQRVRQEVHAVQDVSFSLPKGRTLALVGESGCGKSTLGRSVLRLTEPRSGRVRLAGRDITALGPAQLRAARRDMQLIFQDPFASLDPRMRLLDQVSAPLRNFDLTSGPEAEDRAAALFERVGLAPDLLLRYPNELSGGQRQRVSIARARVLSPRLIVADEAVSALDVSVQDRVLELLLVLQAERGLSYLFISHDLAVVERMSHDVAVMYLGRIVEIGPAAAVLHDPRHAYTQALLSAVPLPDPARKLRRDVRFAPLSAPIHDIGHVPEPPVYEEVTPGHLVLQSECGYAAPYALPESLNAR